jgi:hypothetical protein
LKTLTAANHAHTVVFTSKVNILLARNKLHTASDREVRLLIESLPGYLRSKIPEIAAEYHSIKGILLRRSARRMWKTDNKVAAMDTARQSLREFDYAEVAAHNAMNGRLRFNAILNRLYVDGLLKMVMGVPRTEMVPLAVDALVAENNSRRFMNEESRDHLTGLNIVADLAYGAGLSVGMMDDLSSRQEYLNAYRDVLVPRYDNSARNWSDLLLRQVRISAENISPDIQAKSLLLGAKILLEDPDDYVMMHEYAVKLCAVRRELTNRRSTPHMLRRVDLMIARFPFELIDRCEELNSED